MAMNPAYLRLDNVSFKYPATNSASRSLRRAVLASFPIGWRAEKSPDDSSTTIFNDLNLEIREGDRIGLVGPNGAGKSTLLRLLAGIYHPTKGSVERAGKVSTLLGLGAGFVPELTGEENAIRGMLLNGISTAEARRQLIDINDFAGLGRFFFEPVRTYSTGMLMRLMFGINTSGSPDILLIDEIIGVGDVDFQERAAARIERYIGGASILVLASHSGETLNRFCNKTICINKG